MVSFNTTPSNRRIPFVSVEVDNTRAVSGPASLAYRALIIGQKTSAGTAAANSLHRVTSAEQVRVLAGRGSQLHRQAKAWFAGNRSIEVWVGVLADDGAGVAATANLAITGPASADGTLSLYIGGRAVRIAVASGTAASAIAVALEAAINADLDMAATAADDGAEVDLTHRHKGLVGNELDVRLNYQQGEALPAGVGVTITPFASGTTAPALADLIAALGDMQFHVIAHPYTDATSLAALETELSRRFGPTVQLQGHAFAAKNAAYGTVAALGDGRNSPHSTIVRTNDSPTPPEEYAAHVAAVAAGSAQVDPARPFQTLQLPYVLPPASVVRDDADERNLLLFDGISTTRVGPGDVVQIERLITTYKQNGAGADDTSYLDVTTMLTLMYARHALVTRIATRYPRHKLGNDSTRYPSGEAIITPNIGRAEALAWFDDMSSTSPVVFDPSARPQFKAELVCERNVSDPNRLDWLVSPDLMNQLIASAVNLQFLL